jgi:hypothetical protein
MITRAHEGVIWATVIWLADRSISVGGHAASMDKEAFCLLGGYANTG